MCRDAFNSEVFNDRFLNPLDTTTLLTVTKNNFAASESVSALRNTFE